MNDTAAFDKGLRALGHRRMRRWHGVPVALLATVLAIGTAAAVTMVVLGPILTSPSQNVQVVMLTFGPNPTDKVAPNLAYSQLGYFNISASVGSGTITGLYIRMQVDIVSKGSLTCGDAVGPSQVFMAWESAPISETTTTYMTSFAQDTGLPCGSGNAAESAYFYLPALTQTVTAGTPVGFGFQVSWTGIPALGAGPIIYNLMPVR